MSSASVSASASVVASAVRVAKNERKKPKYKLEMLCNTKCKRMRAKHITGRLARSYSLRPSGSHIDTASLRNARPSSRRRAQASPRGLAHRAQASAYGA